MKDNLYTITFAAILGTACALLLTGVARFTEPYQVINAAAEKNRNIFTALNIEFNPKASSEELNEIFKKNIVEEKGKDDITLYKYKDESGKTLGVAVDLIGAGLWGPIKGFLALEPDMKTIRGITFYEQVETPGLGGEISTEKFRNGFVGKQIEGPDGKPGIVIKTGLSSPAVNEIDGITSATMTCDKVAEMLNKTIEKLQNS